MIHEIRVPSAGESVSEVYIGQWRKNNGDIVQKGEVLVDLESQKASFELESEFSGRLEILYPNAGDTVTVDEVIAKIDDSAKASSEGKAPSQAATPATLSQDVIVSPSVRKLITENNLNPAQIQGTGKDGRITKDDVLNALKQKEKPAPAAQAPTTRPQPSAPEKPQQQTVYIETRPGQRREQASRIRRQIAKNLKNAQNTAAILTTFNEVDMSQILAFRKKHKETFKEKYGVGLGMVGFFALAAVRAAKEFPEVNAYFTGEEIVYNDFVDISIAVSTERGLVVPVMRNVQDMTLVDFEKSLSEISTKAREGKLSIPDMTGGTFTISNGGVFGSMLSTPILNMPQSAILGLHKIEKRPVVVDDEIVIRPMMYLAMSYDHRIIDGKEAVQYLVRIKESIEDLSLIVDESKI